VSTERQRDAETDRLLRATLQPGVHAETCPGPDMLAAYAEGALAPAERDGIEVHFAECHRCQEALAFMARTSTAPDAAPPSREGRWWSLRLRWLIPAAAAAVIVMYVAVRPVIAPYFPPIYQPSTVVPPPAQEHVMADARQQERGAITDERAVAGAGRIPAAGTSAAKGAGRASEIEAQLPEAGRAEQFAALPKPDSKGAELMGEARARAPMSTTSGAGQDTVPRAPDVKGAIRAGDAGAGTRTAAEAPRLPATVVNQARAGSPPPAAIVVNEALAVSPPPAAPAPAMALSRTGAPASPPTAVPASAPTMATDASRQQLAMEGSASAPRDVMSPDGSAVWRIVPGGRLLRSTDRGTTWQAQPTGVSKERLAGSAGVSKELLAGSAPSATVCWIVGREATIIVTTDGVHWATRPFPERVDLIAVEAADARSATVTTRDGRRFATLDGGATWSAK